MSFQYGAPAVAIPPNRAYVDKIKNTFEVENEFSVHDSQLVQEVLKQEGLKEIAALKSLVKDMDMTAISTRELASIGALLSQLGLTETFAASLFFSGNRDCDENGMARNLDIKFNAIALFNQRYQGHLEFSDSHPRYEKNPGFQEWGQGLKSANHLLGVLAWFSRSPGNVLAISERV